MRTQTDLRELDVSQAHTTSLSGMMPDQSSMHHKGAQLLCSPWCLRNWMSSWNKEHLYQWRSPQTGCPHLPTHGKPMENSESAWTQEMSIKPSRGTTNANNKGDNTPAGRKQEVCQG